MNLTNRTAVKRAALDLAFKSGCRQFTRVGAGFLDYIEERVRQTVADAVHRHPRRGKTLQRP